MKTLRTRRFLVLFVPILLLAGGCAGKIRSFTEEKIDLGFVQRVAVLPLENHTEAPFADERIRDLLSTAILHQGYFRTVSQGDVERFLREEIAGRNPTSLDERTGRRLADDLRVDAYFTGSIDDYSELRNGTYAYPVVAATLRMVDARSGAVLWQATGSASGYSTWGRLFGLASEDVNRVSFLLIEDLLKTLR